MNLFAYYEKWEAEQERIRQDKRAAGDAKMRARALRMKITCERGQGGWRSRRLERYKRQLAREISEKLEAEASAEKQAMY